MVGISSGTARSLRKTPRDVTVEAGLVKESSRVEEHLSKEGLMWLGR